jgi:ferredoxin/flavodoxin
MNIKFVSVIYFSPTGTTEKIILTIAEGIGIIYGKIDVTLFKARHSYKQSFGEDDLVIVGMPVYAGRLPWDMDDLFAGMNGNSTPAVAVVAYGNRDYNDALLELKMRLEARGFIVMSAAAFIGEHTLSPKIATGRPDANDLDVALEFGNKTARLLAGNTSGRLTVKGNYPFAWKGTDPKVTPEFPPRPRLVTNDSCTQCKLCSQNCPWEAIHHDDSRIRDYSKCTFCYRCIKYCPSHAIQVTNDKFLAYLPQFEQMLSARREPEMFFSGE